MTFDHLDDPDGFVPDDGFRAAAQRDGRRRRRRRRLALTGGSTIASLLLVVVALGGYGLWRTSRIDRVPVDFATEPVDLGQPFNLLLIGSDQRSDPAEDVAGARSDTMIVVRVEPAERHVVMLSLPRDLAIAFHDGETPRRLNQAFLEGGPSQLVQTVEERLGIPLSAYAEISFDGLTELVDAVGGLDLSVDSTVRDQATGLDLEPSTCASLDGQTILALLRSRHLQYLGSDGQWVDDPSSDLGRMARQRAVLTALVPHLADLAGSVGGIDAALGVLDDHVALDSRFRVTTMLGLARWATDGPPPTMEDVVLPLADLTTAEGARVLELDTGADQVVARVGGALPLVTSGSTPLTAGTITPGNRGIDEGAGLVPIGPCR